MAAARNRRTPITSVLATAVAGAITLTGFGAVSADAVVEPPRPAFYETPATLPAANGAVIRSEKQSFLLDPLDASSLVRNSTRVLYKSTNRAGKAIAVSGTVMVPTSKWVGLGSRPVIGLAPGTQGMADRCAPSRQYSEGLEYEAISAEPLLARGYAVAITDYEGLGTVGVHTYMD
ncbi:MAG: lipase, partial [Myxococcales bacterium]